MEVGVVPPHFLGPVEGRLAWAARQQWGRVLVDVGQGRGGECQFLSVLFLVDWERGVRRAHWWVSWERVDAFRGMLARWLELHQDDCPNPGTGAPSLRDLCIMSGKVSWAQYLREVGRGGWGDAFTLLAAAGVLGRAIVPAAISRQCGGVSCEPVVPPACWGTQMSDAEPLTVGVVAGWHYFPLVR